MKKHKGFGISLGFLILGLFLSSNLCAAEGEPTPMLGEILKKTEANYQQMQALTAYFRQTTTSAVASGMATEASGKLYYEKPKQMRWEYDKPEAQTFVANQQVAWLYVPNEKQISLYDAKALFSSPLAQTFFEGVVELRNNFDVTVELRQSNSAKAVLKLVPKQEDPQIKLLFLWIDLPSYRISTIESHDALGNTNRIDLDSQVAVASLDQKLFQLVVPPSTIVMDAQGKQLTASEIDALKRKITTGRKPKDDGR